MSIMSPILDGFLRHPRTSGHNFGLQTRMSARRCGGFTDHLKEWLCNIRHTKPQQYPVLTSPKVVG
ncbi:unnamed protein product [Brassica rapa subsp. narinosa]